MKLAASHRITHVSSYFINSTSDFQWLRLAGCLAARGGA